MREPVEQVARRGQSCVLGRLVIAAIVLAGCANPPPRSPPGNPDAVRAEIVRLMPAKVENANGWAIDIFAAFEYQLVRREVVSGLPTILVNFKPNKNYKPKTDD